MSDKLTPEEKAKAEKWIAEDFWRYEGEWVAISNRKRRVVLHAETLRELLGILDGQEEPSRSQEKPTIMYVEDSPHLRRVLRYFPPFA